MKYRCCRTSSSFSFVVVHFWFYLLFTHLRREKYFILDGILSIRNNDFVFTFSVSSLRLFTLSSAAFAQLCCSFHILTPIVIKIWTSSRQNEIYLSKIDGDLLHHSDRHKLRAVCFSLKSSADGQLSKALRTDRKISKNIRLTDAAKCQQY